MKSLFLFLVLISVPCFGQSGRTSFEGLATDQNGNILNSADVKVVLLADQTAYTTRTDDRGRFRFVHLPIGNYRIEIQAVSSQMIFKKWIDLREQKRGQEHLIVLNEPCESIDGYEKDIVISKQDISGMVASILASYIIKPSDNYPDLIIRKYKLILSKENIEELALPDGLLSEFDLMSEKEFKAKEDYKYIQISDIAIKNGCVAISTEKNQPRNNPSIDKQRKLTKYEFIKQGSKWIQSLEIESFF